MGVGLKRNARVNFPSTRQYLKFDWRTKLRRLEGRVKDQYSTKVSAGKEVGGMLSMLVAFMHYFKSFPFFLSYLIHHHSDSTMPGMKGFTRGLPGADSGYEGRYGSRGWYPEYPG